MRKHTKRKVYNPRNTFYKYLSLTSFDKHNNLCCQVIEGFKNKFTRFHNNMLQSKADEVDIKYLNGLVELLKIIDANSNRVLVDEALKIYMTIEPIRKDIATRYIDNGVVGYLNDDEQEIMHKVYDVLINKLSNMTNFIYDQFVNLVCVNKKNEVEIIC